MEKEFNVKWLEDPQVFKVNRLDAVSDHKYFKDADEAYDMLSGVAGYDEASGYVTKLDGMWKFSYAKNIALSPVGFESDDYDVRGWDDIKVPGCISFLGYGKPHYINITYPWDGTADVMPGEVPVEFNPVGSYVTFFEKPELKKGEKAHIVFEGTESAFALWLNGSFVGYCEDTYTPSRFDITDLLREGENRLAVKVFRFCTGSWLEDQDLYRTFGIFRSVKLYVIPEVHVSDLFVHADYETEADGSKNGLLNLEIKLYGEKEKTVKGVLLSEDEDGNFLEADLFDEKVDASVDELEIDTKIEKVALWSAEKPNLYTLLVTVFDADGKPYEVITQKIGFRRFEMKNGLMLINGERIVFKGTNRHEFDCDLGRALTPEIIYGDLLEMKRQNINGVRTSHYPNQSIFYDYCDELGLYVIDETNLETHGTWSTGDPRHEGKELPGNDEKWTANVVDRATSMLERDKNHPCILIWSCGNESFGGRNIFEMSEFFRHRDPSRLVHYEGLCHDRSYNATSDMESQMYPKVDDIIQFLEEHDDKPFLCCEYTHSMGNSNGNMKKYTDLAYSNPRYQGGFIWDYVDQCVRAKDARGNDYLAYGGDLGDRPSDYHFCGDGIMIADRKKSPKLAEVKYDYQGVEIYLTEKTVRFVNRNLFTNVDEYDCEFTLRKEGRLISRYVTSFDVAPLTEATYDIEADVPEMPGEYVLDCALLLTKNTPYAQAGYEVAFGECVVKRDGEKPSRNGVKPSKLEIINGYDNLGVKGCNFSIIFAKDKKGSILSMISYKFNGEELLVKPPVPNFWRAETDNDQGNGMSFGHAVWKIASLYQGIINVDMDTDEKVVFNYTYALAGDPELTCSVRYEVNENGFVKTTLSLPKSDKLIAPPEFGMIFKLSEEYGKLVYYGYGPEENYCDRANGVKLSVYETNVKDCVTPYLRPQECGNHTGVRYAKLLNNKGFGVMFKAEDEMEFVALPYTPHEVEAAAHYHELPDSQYVYARPALKRLGVGGDDSWGAPTHPEYHLDITEGLEFSFEFGAIAE